MKIKTRITRIKDKIAKLEQQIVEIRSSCEHLVHFKTARSNSGGWDNRDEYWYDCSCNDCGQFWRIDQDDYRIHHFKGNGK